MASSQNLENFKSITSKTLSFDTDKIIKRSQLGELNFEEIEKEFLELTSILHEIKDLDLAIIPDNIVSNISSYLTNINTQLTSINSFSLKSVTNPPQQRQVLINAFRQHYGSFFSTIPSWYSLLKLRSQESSSQIDEIKQAYESIQKDIQKTKKDIEEKKKEMDVLVNAAKTSASEVGVAQFTKDFHNEYDEFIKTSTKWLIITSIFAAITLCMVTYLVFHKFEINNTYEAIHIFSSKILLFILFAGVTLWSGKQYSAAKHQAVINKHKSNSLNTFQAFTEASYDESTKDAVLLEATKAIFSLPDSGYIDNKSTCNDRNTKTIEIVRSSSKITSDLAKNF